MDLKANKVDSTPSSVSVSTIIAEEYNQLITEQNNLLDEAGITPSSSNLHQITEAVKEISGNNDWQKPSEWVDIRSGALPNSIYFLVGHSADFTKYPEFSFTATISNSGTYDVFVDGIKQATTASGSDTVFNWQTLNLAIGFDVTYPEALRTHIVRVTPTADTNTINAIKLVANSSVNQGLLWAHFSITNEININRFLGNNYSGVTYQCPLIEVVTSTDNTLKIANNGLTGAFVMATNLKQVPILDAQNKQSGYNYAFRSCENLKKIKIINAKQNPDASYALAANCYALKEMDITPSLDGAYGDVFLRNRNLKKIPSINLSKSAQTNFTEMYKLQDTFLDFSTQQATTGKWSIYGTEGNIQNIVGILVNPSMTVNGNFDFRYNKMNRQALINLFNTLPYNVGYEVVGELTIDNGVASGFGLSNYLRIPSLVPAVSNFEFNCKFTTGTEFVGENYTLFVCGNLRIGYSPEGYIGCRIPKNGTYAEFLLSDSVVLTTNTTYIEKVTYDGNSLTLSIYDANNLLIASQSWQDDGLRLTKGQITIGYAGTSTFLRRGELIDLNNTYINVNGVPWFRGTAQTTRTLDIRGCTGTADLTQNDKNIVLNKGWELTVA